MFLHLVLTLLERYQKDTQCGVKRNIFKTRIHSSRMRTARLLPVSPSMHCSGEGCTCWGVYLPRGEGYLPKGEGVPAQGEGVPAQGGGGTCPGGGGTCPRGRGYLPRGCTCPEGCTCPGGCTCQGVPARRDVPVRGVPARGRGCVPARGGLPRYTRVKS